MDNLDILQLSMDNANRRVQAIIATLEANNISVVGFELGDLDVDPVINLKDDIHIQLTDQFGGGLNKWYEDEGMMECLHFGSMGSIINHIKEHGLC